jgi:hypothetical protein
MGKTMANSSHNRGATLVPWGVWVRCMSFGVRCMSFEVICMSFGVTWVIPSNDMHLTSNDMHHTPMGPKSFLS